MMPLLCHPRYCKTVLCLYRQESSEGAALLLCEVYAMIAFWEQRIKTLCMDWVQLVMTGRLFMAEMCELSIAAYESAIRWEKESQKRSDVE